MAATITQAEFTEALGRYPEALKTHGKTPKDGSATMEDLDKFRCQTAPMNFSKNTGRIMELSDVEKLVQWKIHHGKFRPTLPKLVASNTNETVAAALKDAWASYAEDNKDIAKVISKLTTPLKGIGPATASLLLAIHDPQNVVFFSDELFSYLTADGKKVEPKYVTKEFETIHTEAQKIISRLNCAPIELEKVAYVLVNEKAPEVKKAGRPVPAPKEKKAYTGAPRGRPKMTEAEKKAQQARREAARKPSKSAINRTRTGRVVKPTEYLVNQTSDKKEPKAKRPGRPAAKVAAPAKPAKKRGRPAAVKPEGAQTKAKAKTDATSAALKKAGRPAGKVAPKKVGRPAAAIKKAGTVPAKKAGRPAKATKVAEASTSTPKKRGRPSAAATEATTATPASKKRGRPSQADKEAAAQTPASKKKKTAATPATAPASLKRAGRPPGSTTAAKRVGRKSII